MNCLQHKYFVTTIICAPYLMSGGREMLRSCFFHFLYIRKKFKLDVSSKVKHVRRSGGNIPKVPFLKLTTISPFIPAAAVSSFHHSALNSKRTLPNPQPAISSMIRVSSSGPRTLRQAFRGPSKNFPSEGTDWILTLFPCSCPQRDFSFRPRPSVFLL